VDRLEAAITKFKARAAAYKARAAKIPAARRVAVNRLLMLAEKKLNKGFTALDAWDTTVYPHAQVQWDLEQIDAALAGLNTEPVVTADVTAALKGIGITDPYGLDFGYENYLMQLEMHRPGWAGGLFWGAQGQLSPYLDVIPVLQKVDEGHYAGAAASLQVMQDAEVYELNKRMDSMAATVDAVNSLLPTIR